MFNRAYTFLKNPKKFLQTRRDNLGYDTCHRTKNYDATECYQDCKQLEKSDFSKQCEEDGGLFKCCIR